MIENRYGQAFKKIRMIGHVRKNPFSTQFEAGFCMVSYIKILRNPILVVIETDQKFRVKFF